MKMVEKKNTMVARSPAPPHRTPLVSPPPPCRTPLAPPLARVAPHSFTRLPPSHPIRSPHSPRRTLLVCGGGRDGWRKPRTPHYGGQAINGCLALGTATTQREPFSWGGRPWRRRGLGVGPVEGAWPAWLARHRPGGAGALEGSEAPPRGHEWPASGMPWPSHPLGRAGLRGFGGETARLAQPARLRERVLRRRSGPGTGAVRPNAERFDWRGPWCRAGLEPGRPCLVEPRDYSLTTLPNPQIHGGGGPYSPAVDWRRPTGRRRPSPTFGRCRGGGDGPHSPGVDQRRPTGRRLPSAGAAAVAAAPSAPTPPASTGVSQPPRLPSSGTAAVVVAFTCPVSTGAGRRAGVGRWLVPRRRRSPRPLSTDGKNGQ